MAESTKGGKQKKLKGNFVYGLDIGTRSIVGTVGYPEKDGFVVVSQKVKEHETRAMIDGQIHDIAAVGETIRYVTDELEKEVGEKLKSVCIAAAGRVLRTVNTHVDMEFDEEKTITREDIFALDSLGIEKSYENFVQENNTDLIFYCVGYTVMRYQLNHYPMMNLENHKARSISADLIATFLPDEVVDGLYKAVEMAGLEVANLTLEPIAAMEVAIPANYRMLNIALIDVGAGTSDISITRGGSIVAYGMLPIAGDMLTEEIAMHCLVDFATAEQIKRGIGETKEVQYKDIMGLDQKISRQEVLDTLSGSVQQLAQQAADKIRELNGDKPVSAVFVVGGGGKIAGYTDAVADALGIARERCALRGEEVMQKIRFLQKDVVKDSLLVTPVGICLNFYQQSNNFIFVTFNGSRIKLYDNSRLAVVDAAMGAGFSNEDLFPKRGDELLFTFNGKAKTVRGQLGESCRITVNGKNADINTPIHSNDVINVTPSTKGETGSMLLERLTDLKESIRIRVGNDRVSLPKFATVNGRLETAGYEIKAGDVVEILPYYTVQQIAEVMDVTPDEQTEIRINHEVSDLSGKVYDNFILEFGIKQDSLTDAQDEETETDGESWDTSGDAKAQIAAIRKRQSGQAEENEDKDGQTPDDKPEDTESQRVQTPDGGQAGAESQQERTPDDKPEDTESQQVQTPDGGPIELNVIINGRNYIFKGKSEYVYVDAFDYIDLDLSKPQGKFVETLLNGRKAQYMEKLNDGDVLSIGWKD